MSLTLSDFTLIVETVLSYAVSTFDLAKGAILIDDGTTQISLFHVALGFIVLEFIIYTINRLRTPHGDMTGLNSNQSTGGQPANKFGGYGNKGYGPQRPRKY
jgi:hypothetical protein